jgi:pilus assembly protein CpaB
MNRRTRTLIVVGVAVALASLASFGVYRTIQQMPVRQVPIAERFTVVASQNVPVGMLLTKDMVRLVGWPADHPIAGGFATAEEVVGRGVTSGLVENEPITENKLAPRSAGGGLTATITPGMRAMSVKVNDVIGVAGFTVPGTHVDVVVTINSDRESVSRTVISNVQVLTAGTKFDADKSRDGAPIASSVVTLLVTPADAERLALATTQGQIVLALRNPLDVEPTKTNGIRTSGLVSSPDAAPVRTVAPGRPARMVAPAPPPAPEPPSVVMIRGAKATKEIIK